MITLEEAKVYLKVESNVTEDDDLISALILAAAEYISKATGKADEGSKIYDLCEKILVAHWYENRGTATTANIIEMPHAVQAMLTHIKLSGAYPESGDHDGT
jgi:uncharacterized phage protein (predicted DNA packaging)